MDKGIIFPNCEGLMTTGCFGVITGSGDYFGVIYPDLKGVIVTGSDFYGIVHTD